MKLDFLFRDICLGANRKVSFAVVVWFALAFIAVLAELFHNKINNYLIFKQVFWHVIDQKNLYDAYPAEYEDHNFYGPIFSFVIALPALLPNWLGVIVWVLLNAFFLFYAIKQLPLKGKAINTIFLISAIELMTSSHNVQFNAMVASWIILSYTFVHRGKVVWATFFIALGILSKIYGVVGVLFFLFSKDKLQFIGWFIFWLLVLFCLPMLISSPAYIIDTYKDWANTLVYKNQLNTSIAPGNMQDMSVMGIIKRVFRYPGLSNLTVVVPAALLMALPLLRFKLYNNLVFQLSYLALTLISVVIFSSGAESATFVIALVGVALWFVLDDKKAFTVGVLCFVILVTSLGTTDLVPQFIKRNFIRPYALKAFPCLIVWLILVYNIAFKKESELASPELIADKNR